MAQDWNEHLPPGLEWPEKFEPGKIAGVVVKDLEWHLAPDGGLLEIFKEHISYCSPFAFEGMVQANLSFTLPGTIKAFHAHEKQDDAWFLANGQIQVVLADLRKNFAIPGELTWGIIQSVIMSGVKPQVLVIPKGVVHGFKVMGSQNAELIYFVSRLYNSTDPDEGRIAWNHPKIAFDWSPKFE